jgi:dTDP-glucose 4,6-dehydratase
MRVFVTGAAGFIGSHYVRTMLSGGYPAFGDAEVTVFDKLTYAGNLDNLAPVADNPRYRFVQGDICDAAQLADVLPGHDVVVNFAAESHVDRSIFGAAEFVVTNVLGAQTLFDACVKADVSRVVHVSTDEVYGTIPEGSWTEEHILEPNSPYSASKAGADLLARAYAGTYGLNISVTRCTNNYGQYQFPEKVIPLFVTNLIDGRRVPLYGDGMNIRDWLHVSDHCRGIQLVVERVRDEQGNHLLGELETPVVVRTIRDRNWQLKRLEVCANRVVPAGLRRVVGRAGPIRRRFRETLVAVQREIAVHLAGGDVMEP